jgi:excisionase family DNA binding protein
MFALCYNALAIVKEVLAMANEQDTSGAFVDKKTVPERWANIREIAEHLGVSDDTIRIWIRKDKIPYYRIGKQYKFQFSEVDEWVRSRQSADID